MILSTKRVGFIVLVIVLALVGLLIVQGVLIRDAWNAKEQSFQRNVFAALDQAVKQLETGEAMSESIRTMSLPHGGTWAGVKIVTTAKDDSTMLPSDDSTLDLYCDTDVAMPLRLQNDSLIYNVGSPQHVTISVFNPDSGVSRTIVDTFRGAGRYAYKLDRKPEGSSAYVFRYETDTNSFMFRTTSSSHSEDVVSLLDARRPKKALIQRVLTQMLTVEMKPMEQRVDSAKLDSAVARALKSQGIDLEYGYGVISHETGSLSMAVPVAATDNLLQSGFRTRLFPQDLLSRPADLVLYFPGRQAYLWRQMGPMLAAMVLFMLVIVFCFAYAIRVIARQRRFTARMTDFINNMTHEFKTPIATVALASEAISRADVAAEPDRLSRFNRMIQDETSRMRTQVDKILQMAVLEEGDYDLNLTEVDVHATLAKVVENAALHVTARGGRISTDLAAERPVIMADRLHLTNLVHNLLDNANKYSSEAPDIAVSTHNTANGIEIAIADHGIGIAAADQKAVFDKYFRVSNGNVHNVKGFGLGLSYVKLMVNAHGGTIQLESSPGAGTTVRVSLPFDGPKEAGK
jgi:two-component system phosphate regulon sensor histidine kinase PhoR